MSETKLFLKLHSLLEREDYERGLTLATQLVEEHHANWYVHYTISACLIQLDRSDSAKTHLEMAAFLFGSLRDSESFDLESWINIARLLTRTQLHSTAIKLIEDLYERAVWDPSSLGGLRELIRLCIVLEEPSLGLKILSSSFDTYNESSLITDYLILVATTAHAADDEELEIQTYIRGLEIDPLNTELHSRLSRFLGRIRSWELASDHIKFIHRLDPQFETRSIAQDFYNLSKTGSFDEQEILRQKWVKNEIPDQDSKAPFASLIASDDGAFLLREAQSFATWTLLLPNREKKTSKNISLSSSSMGKIRVGYVSPDFRDHAVSHLITDLIRSHDRGKFDVFGYGISMYDNSPCRERITSAFDTFHGLEHNKTSDIVKQIHSDSLDIVIDLAGYTQGFNQTLFDRINGPIIVNYLGYPGTTGHPRYDYILADPIVIPESHDKFYSEQVWRLDCCYQANSPSRDVVEVDFQDTLLPEDSFIFCNFNGRQKLNRETLHTWQKIILACPDSVLWLLDPGSETRAEILKVLDSIQSRVYFAPFKETAKHLGRVKHANLFLDSFPYGAHTTASDAVFAGIPILARSGEGFQSRVAQSIIHYAGLPEMYANNWQEFYEKAIQFYQTYDLEQKMRMNKILLDRSRDRHPYNIDWTTRQIEKAYSSMLAQ